MRSRWKESAAGELREPGQVAYVARLLGAEDALVLPGAGSVSLKRIEVDAMGRRLSVMHVSPEGADLAALRAADLVPLDLDDIEPHVERTRMDAAAVAAALARAPLDARRPAPTCETLLHAFLPDRWVLHTHPDALLALCGRPDGAARLLDAVGNDAVLVGARRPGGFKLACDVAAARRANPAAKGVVLLNHGLVTYAGDPHEAYQNHLALVAECEAALPTTLPVTACEPDRGRAAWFAPRLRGRLGGGVLLFDDREEVRAFVADEALLLATTRGAASADLLRRMGVPSIARAPGDAAPGARTVLVPGVGLWTAGATCERAAVARDAALHGLRIVRRCGPDWEAPAGPPGSVRPDAAPPGELGGRIAWITYAVHEPQASIALRLAAEGAHVMLVDADEAALRRLGAQIGARAAAMACDPRDDDAVRRSFEQLALVFGGLDIVVAGEVPAAALEMFCAQGLGGSVVLTGGAMEPRRPRAAGVRVNVVAGHGDVTEAALFLASDRSRGVHGAALPVRPLADP